MPNTKPPSPEDPAWVDDIVKRALERAGSSDPASTESPQTPSVVTPPDTPTSQIPLTTQAPQAPAAPARPVAAAPTVPRPQTVAQRPVQPTPQMVAEQTTDELFSPDTDTSGDSHSPVDAPAAQDPNTGRSVDTPYPDSTATDIGQMPAVDTMSQRMRGFLEWGAVIVGALAVALVIKTFLMQAYFIPSESMVPTLMVGDRVLVNKLSYEFGDVSRGDLIVFRRPPAQVSGEDDLIKRVIALEGETIEIRDNTIFITQPNSTTTQQLTEPYLVEGMAVTGFLDTSGCASATSTSCTVPAGSVFVMGDNRDRSRDGRSFGPISEDLIVGRAFLRVWPLGDISFL